MNAHIITVIIILALIGATYTLGVQVVGLGLMLAMAFGCLYAILWLAVATVTGEHD